RGSVFAFATGLLDGALTSLLYCGAIGTGEAINGTGNTDNRSVGENQSSEMHRHLGASLHAARADNMVDYSLNIASGWNDDMIARVNREGRREIDAIAGLGSLGIYSAAQSQQDLGSGGNLNGLGGCGSRRRSY